MRQIFVRSALTMALSVAAAAAHSQSMDALNSVAEKENALIVNGGGPARLYEPWVREFEQHFPGIEVTLAADFSNILSPKIDHELADHKLSVDLTIFQTLQDYDRWKKGGALMAFRPEGWDQIDPSFKDPDGQFVGLAICGLSYAYNTNRLDKAQVPKSAMDFLNPSSAGRSLPAEADLRATNPDDAANALANSVVSDSAPRSRGWTPSRILKMDDWKIRIDLKASRRDRFH